MARPRGWIRSQLLKLMTIFGGRCWWCDCEVVVRDVGDGESRPRDTGTRDHVVPVSRRGSNKLSNLVLACSDCNTRRGDLSPERWAKKLRHRGLEPPTMVQYHDLLTYWKKREPDWLQTYVRPRGLPPPSEPLPDPERGGSPCAQFPDTHVRSPA